MVIVRRKALPEAAPRVLCGGVLVTFADYFTTYLLYNGCKLLFVGSPVSINDCARVLCHIAAYESWIEKG